MQITAALVKELRERTGAGMMECKKALTASNGDIDAAIEAMRKAGQAKADKKSGRIAAEGLVVVQQAANIAAMVEINSETDFVAKGDDFINFCNSVATVALENRITDLEALLAADLNGASVEETRKNLIAKIGENINVRRVVLVEGDNLGVYRHGERIGVLTNLTGGDETLARDVAMHVAASRPMCVEESEVPADVLAKEKEILIAQAKESGKPDNIIDKMIVGRIKKYLKEITLLGQPFVKDPDQSVEQLVKANNAKVEAFVRFEVGEGIEKKEENFADEVMQQVQGA